MDKSLLKQKFRGTILGALAGDCFGGPFEFEKLTPGSKLVLQEFFDTVEKPNPKALPVKQYSDDSAMTYSLALSLIENKKLDLVDVAKKFVRSFYKEPYRNYGSGVPVVFEKLRGNKFSNVFGPAKEQFNGSGSWGNGAAMRVSPIPLFCYNNYNKLVDMTRQQSLITHAHKLGVDGAILQAIAIHQALHLDPAKNLNTKEFIDELINKMNSIEVDEEGLGLTEAQPYKIQLQLIKEYISQEGEGPSDDEVIQKLGVDVSAIRSVPTAVFCFLRASKPIQGINTDNPLRRAIQYAISFSGDADTVGSMTGSIAGAFYGEEKLSPHLLEHCEAAEEFRKIADDLFSIVTTKE